MYNVFLSSGFIDETRLKEHCLFENEFIDVVLILK